MRETLLGVWVAAASLWPVRAHYVLTFGTERPKGGEKSAHRKHKEKKSMKLTAVCFHVQKKGCESSKEKKVKLASLSHILAQQKMLIRTIENPLFFRSRELPKKRIKEKEQIPLTSSLLFFA